MKDETKVRKLAQGLSAKARTLGQMTVIRDFDSRAYAVPGPAEIVGHYDDRITTAELNDDLQFSEVRR